MSEAPGGKSLTVEKLKVDNKGGVPKMKTMGCLWVGPRQRAEEFFGKSEIFRYWKIRSRENAFFTWAGGLSRDNEENFPGGLQLRT